MKNLNLLPSWSSRRRAKEGLYGAETEAFTLIRKAESIGLTFGQNTSSFVYINTICWFFWVYRYLWCLTKRLGIIKFVLDVWAKTKQMECWLPMHHSQVKLPRFSFRIDSNKYGGNNYATALEEKILKDFQNWQWKQ